MAEYFPPSIFAWRPSSRSLASPWDLRMSIRRLAESERAVAGRFLDEVAGRDRHVGNQLEDLGFDGSLIHG
jgi:hypothetical protein